MADEEKPEMQDMRDVLGAEHFPPCLCFQDRVRGPQERTAMYVMAQEYANGFMSNMISGGACPEAMPYFIALFNNMCYSMAASYIVAQTHGQEITPEGTSEFSRIQHEMWNKVKERMDALMRRADRLTFGVGEGTDSVQ